MSASSQREQFGAGTAEKRNGTAIASYCKALQKIWRKAFLAMQQEPHHHDVRLKHTVGHFEGPL